MSRLASLRLAGPAGLALAAAVALGACTAETVETPSPSPSPSATAIATPGPTVAPTPTPAPTPRYTNEPDDELAALIPTEAAGVPIVVAPFDEFGLTPGDIGAVYGEIGDRFVSLVLAYSGEPRTTLYAMRVDGEPVATEDLEPHLATAGRYVGIAGLDPDPWELTEVGGNLVWTRPEDNATVTGTTLYTWASGEFVFLLIGESDALNRAIVEQLPGEAAAPSPSPSATESGAPAETGSAGSSPSESSGG